jgi:phage tail tape-measure protein
VNSGHKSESQIYSTLDTTAGKLATAGATAAVGALIGSAVPLLGTAIGAAAGWLAGEITGVLDADCDGAVAAEQDTFSLSALNDKCEHGTFTQTTYHPGTDSASGCGSNSQYYVTWHIQKVK